MDFAEAVDNQLTTASRVQEIGVGQLLKNKIKREGFAHNRKEEVKKVKKSRV